MDTKPISNAPTDVSDDEAISRFADQLIEEKGLGGLGEAEKTKLREELADKLIERVNKALIFALPDDKFHELQEALRGRDAAEDAETMDEISKIVASANLDMQKIVTETAEEFRRAFLEGDADESGDEVNNEGEEE